MSFTSSMDLIEVELSIVPELESFVSVYPESFSNVVANSVNTFQISIAVPPDTTVDEAYEGTISLAVGDQDCPETAEIKLYVAPTLETMTEDSFNETMELQIEACELFYESEQYSGTEEAREFTLGFLSEQSEVFDAGISEDGSIWIVYKKGIHSLISTSPPGTLGSGHKSIDAEVLGGALASTTDYVTPGNKKAILLWTFCSDPTMQPVGMTLNELMDELSDSLAVIGYEVTSVRDADVTVDLLKSLYSYGVVDFLTHGAMSSNQIALMTGEKATFGSFFAHRSDLMAHRLELIVTRTAFYGKIPVEFNWGIRPSFVTHYAVDSYPNSLVVASACSSLANYSMASAFLDAGAYVYTGWTDTAYSSLDIDLFEYLIEGISVEQAFSELDDEGATTCSRTGAQFRFYPSTHGDYKLLGEEEPVYFPDPNLEAAIREAISKLTGDIYPSNLAELTSLSAYERNIADLTGLEYCTSLTSLDVQDNQISDILPLASLTNLIWLNLDSNQISNISPLANLTNLETLELYGNQVSNISHLANLTDLDWLDLRRNQISNISPLANLTDLTDLDLGWNEISNISPLTSLTNLTWLDLSNNQINNVSPLANLTNLTDLNLWSNQVSNISALGNLTNLVDLNLWANQINDVSALANLINLNWLYLSENQINDISPLANLTELTGLYLWGNNYIPDISPLANLTNLNWLYLEANYISNISPLANLTNLSQLGLSNNQISDIGFLVENEGLGTGDVVDLRWNPLNSDSINIYIPQLEARGVTVYY